MDPRLNTLKLAALQAQKMITLPAQTSRLAAWAMAVHRMRKQLKQNMHLWLRTLKHRPVAPGGPLRVLVHVRGGIGDVCMTRIFVKSLREALPKAEILFCYDSKAVVDAVFQDGQFINGFQNRKYIPQEFDLVISGCHVLRYAYYREERLKQLAPSFMPAFYKGLEMQKIFNIFDQNTPYLDGYLARITVEYGSSRVGNLGLSTGLDVTQQSRAPLTLNEAESRRILKNLGLAGKKYITIHDGINTNTDISLGHPTRCWPQYCWREFALLFKRHFPGILLVQLGGSKSTVFDFADISLVGKTAVQDLPHILNNALLHVDGESGMVQLANLTRVQSVVLFGPTPEKYFGYPQNINLVAPNCQACMNIDFKWMTRCALGYPVEKQCLAAITPQRVMEAVTQALSANKLATK